MKHKKAAKDAARYGTIKVDREFRDQLKKLVTDQGMTTTGAFRRFGDQIIGVIKQEQTTAATAGAV